MIQGSNIDIPGRSFSPKLFLEVQRRLTAPGDATDPVAPWPFNANPSRRR